MFLSDEGLTLETLDFTIQPFHKNGKGNFYCTIIYVQYRAKCSISDKINVSACSELLVLLENFDMSSKLTDGVPEAFKRCGCFTHITPHTVRHVRGNCSKSRQMLVQARPKFWRSGVVVCVFAAKPSLGGFGNHMAYANTTIYIYIYIHFRYFGLLSLFYICLFAMQEENLVSVFSNRSFVYNYRIK